MRDTQHIYPFKIDLSDYRQAVMIADEVQFGHYFVFVDNAHKVLGHSGKRARLLGHLKQRRVLPIVDQPIVLKGVTLKPKPRHVDRLGCLVADRDLYRAEEDVVHLFVAFPDPPEKLRLIVEQNGEPFTEREPELEGGVAVESLAALLPGTYSAQLADGDRRIGMPATFTVAEYTLAPLSARLVSHELQAQGKKLAFELAVESYQVPFADELDVALVEDGREKSRVRLRAASAGRYLGHLTVMGEGSLRLRLIAAGDAQRTAEVVLPGSRADEREETVVSELGKEVAFSLMPRSGAIPLRGGYLSEGEEIETPLVIDNVVTERPVLKTMAAIEDLHLVVLDLADGQWRVEKQGNVEAQGEVEVATRGPVSMVFAGGFVDGMPFEGFTTFLRPSRLKLAVDAPATIRPREDLVVRLQCGASGNGNASVPVLLSVRDERLTATDRPAVGLAASLKRGAGTATAGMADAGFTTLSNVLAKSGGFHIRYARGLKSRGADAIRSLPRGEMSMEFGLGGGALEAVALSAAAPDLDLSADDRGSIVKVITLDSDPADATEAPATPPPRSELPEALFFGLISVSGSEEVTIPLGDSLGTFTVEAFALADGDWTEARQSVVIDQPVRIDLEVPPTVHPDDTVRGRLRAATTSGRARLSLTRDGEAVELLASRTSTPSTGELATPVELEFMLQPGLYLARVEDAESGAEDTLEITVDEPGRFKSYARETALLQEGDSLDLGSAAALSLRVLPSVEGPFDNLVTATAGYAHLCCEQTAAKILSATFMYLNATSPVVRAKAEEIILAGLAREHKMYLRGQGFSLYPGGRLVSRYYSPLAVRYLWVLDQLDAVPDLSGSLRTALEGRARMVDDAALAHGLKRVPEQIESIEDAYAAATAGGAREAALRFIQASLEIQGDEIRVLPPNNAPQHRVAERTFLAYAAAVLIALGEKRLGTRLANLVTRQLNAQGRLYSTVDSVAAIVLMIQLRRAGWVEAGPNCASMARK